MKRQINSRDRILECALALFSKSGYDAVSISDIVEKAGVTKPTLYYFFESKEGLFEQLFRENYTSLDACMAAACRLGPAPGLSETDLLQVLLRVAGALFDFAAKNTTFYLMVLGLTFAPPSSRPAVIAEGYHRKHHDMLAGLFCAISAAHPNISGRERACSWHFLALLNAQIAFWYQGRCALDDTSARSVATQFVHGILS